jgi:hypothetical protein
MTQFKMIHQADQKTIAAMYHEYSPVFVLTAGRSGSKFVAELLNLSPGISAFHEPRPTLQYFSNFACHHQHLAETLNGMIDAARMEMVLETYISGKVFVESNQCLTFFAPALAANSPGWRTRCTNFALWKSPANAGAKKVRHWLDSTKTLPEI